MNIVCETVRDLVPLYLDGTCSSITARFVKRHLKRCKSCAGYCKLCKHSKDVAEQRIRENAKRNDLVFAPDNGYELIARRVGKSIMLERIALISTAVAAIVTTVIIFTLKNKRDR